MSDANTILIFLKFLRRFLDFSFSIEYNVKSLVSSPRNLGLT